MSFMRIKSDSIFVREKHNLPNCEFPENIMFWNKCSHDEDRLSEQIGNCQNSAGKLPDDYEYKHPWLENGAIYAAYEVSLTLYSKLHFESLFFFFCFSFFYFFFQENHTYVFAHWSTEITFKVCAPDFKSQTSEAKDRHHVQNKAPISKPRNVLSSLTSWGNCLRELPLTLARQIFLLWWHSSSIDTSFLFEWTML